MRRFRFRLETVLRVRRVQEDLARAELMTANHAAHERAALVAARTAEYDARELPSGVHSYDTFALQTFRWDAAAGAVTTARAAHRDAMAVVADRRRDWSEARARVAALERLEERRRADHALEVRRAEDRLVDDLVVARHRREDTR